MFAFPIDEKEDFDETVNENDDIHGMKEYMIMLTWIKGRDYD